MTKVMQEPDFELLGRLTAEISVLKNALVKIEKQYPFDCIATRSNPENMQAYAAKEALEKRKIALINKRRSVSHHCTASIKMNMAKSVDKDQFKLDLL